MSENWPSLVQERLAIWGKTIHAQRACVDASRVLTCARAWVYVAFLRGVPG